MKIKNIIFISLILGIYLSQGSAFGSGNPFSDDEAERIRFRIYVSQLGGLNGLAEKHKSELKALLKKRSEERQRREDEEYGRKMGRKHKAGGHPCP